MGLVRTSISMPEDLRDMLVEAAESNNRSVSNMIQMFIKEGLATRNSGTEEKLESTVEKTSKAKEKKDFIDFVQLFKHNSSKIQIIEAMVNSGMSASASTTLYNKLSCVTSAILRPFLKDSTIYQVARFHLHKGEKPEGDKSSIEFCTRVCKAWAYDEDGK